MAIDQHRGALARDIVGAPAHQRIALSGEIGCRRRDVGMAGEPGLDRVPVAGHDLDQLPGGEGMQMRIHHFVHQRIDAWHHGEKHQRRRQCRGACPAKRAGQKAEAAAWARAFARHGGAQGGRGAMIGGFAPDQQPHRFQILQLRRATGAPGQMPLHRRDRARLQLAIEIGLQRQAFTATLIIEGHGDSLLRRRAIAGAATRGRAPGATSRCRPARR